MSIAAGYGIPPWRNPGAWPGTPVPTWPPQPAAPIPGHVPIMSPDVTALLAEIRRLNAENQRLTNRVLELETESRREKLSLRLPEAW